MASAQVLPNPAVSSRKGHLEAGKRKLEEFRKNRARKAASTGQLQSNNSSKNGKQPKERGVMQLTNSDGSNTSRREVITNIEPFSLVTISESKAINSFGTSVPDHAKFPISANNYGAAFANPVQEPAKVREFENNDGSDHHGPFCFNYDRLKDDMSGDFVAYTGSQGLTSGVYGIRDSGSHAHQFNYYSVDEAKLKENETSSKENTSRDSVIPLVGMSVSLPVKSQMRFGSSPSSGNMSTLYEDNAPWQEAESLSTNLRLDLKSSSDYMPLYAQTFGTGSERSRPSFLDSINVAGVSSVSYFPFTESEKHKPFMSKSSKIQSVDILASSSQQQFPESETLRPFSNFRLPNRPRRDELSMNSVSVGNEQEVLRQKLKENSIERKNEFSSLKQDEEIAALEQALRLWSSELKLERQLENSNAEITSYKKKVSSLDKEREELQSTIDALEEEKKLLQSKLRKATGSGKFIDVSKVPSVKKDVSTSTEDLGVKFLSSFLGESRSADMMPSTFKNELLDTASFPLSRTSTNRLLVENRQFLPPATLVSMPPDQLGIINNINSLISELASEKEELIQALATESSNSSHLKDLNKELSRKLEAQTQRLELLTAQSMAYGNILARQTEPPTKPDSTLHTDEGDEVVERVLGWIMKLFPGGPSKRRISKLI
ncbi:PREDICTED: uncharacterized protein LOC104602111 [Nelumbo nucifera]|uniref:Uncharacterized protein LOC104602111 n=2 Tax=Nelumbo nucifera TaxID=4432 RepID=A0A1U8AML7_NELNU|nr:PREDICTED: uncharacterized protein LOC104602111 [Nelumbo nucifera]DAD36924.1 TPA_asm: hypothetical protein HUJ06_007565 [Nelumbo nucifera]